MYRSFAYLLLATVLIAAPARAQLKIGSPSDVLKKGGKVSSTLLSLDGLGKTGVKPGDLLQIADGYVAIVAVPVGRNRDALEADLRALGMRQTAAMANMVSGWFPIQSLSALERLSTLRHARPSYRPFTKAGRVTSEGSAAMNADAARSEWSVDGTGIRVGVISDSYNSRAGAATDIINDDLPSDIHILRDLTTFEQESIGASDEGRAMMQLIHDVAPGAALSFYSGIVSEANMAEAILELARDGADVIVDDIGYLLSPFFQHGIIAQAAAKVVDEGIPYFSAAGNDASQSYESAFRAGPDSVTIYDQAYLPHDFDPGPGIDYFMDIEISAGGRLFPSLQWDQPFASLGGEGSDSDFDMFLIDDRDSIVAIAGEFNEGSDPAEIFLYQTDSSQTVHLLIGKFSGPDPSLIKFIDFGFGVEYEYPLGTGTSFGHPNHPKVMAVGAAYYSKTPAYGTTPPEIEWFSSYGGVDILFDENGIRLATPFATSKPDVVGPDGTSTTFFWQDEDEDGLPNFFGTSAAAPHVAAVAALMLEGAGGRGTLSPTEIYQALKDGTIDMDDPGTEGFDAGFDFATGYGYVQADRAVAATYDYPPVTEDDTISVGSGRVVRIEVLANDSDPENSELTITHVSNGNWGTATISRDGHAVLYQAPGEALEDTLAYVASDGRKESTATVAIRVMESASSTSAVAGAETPATYRLWDNFPDPFNPTTTIRYDLPTSSRVKLQLVDLLGRSLKILVDQEQPAGSYEIRFDAWDLPSGTYLYRLGAADFTQTKTMSLVK